VFPPPPTVGSTWPHSRCIDEGSRDEIADEKFSIPLAGATDPLSVADPTALLGRRWPRWQSQIEPLEVPNMALPELEKTASLGREDSNLRMVESKSGNFSNNFNDHSEKTWKFGPLWINRLAGDSE
jgi:hypothetical protein